MSRPILSRPRTRVYGCNYDKGESYYKPAIENLNRKYSGRPLFPEPRNSLADEIAARRSDIGTRDLAGSRQARLGRSELESDHEAFGRRPLRSLGSPQPDPFFEDEDTVFDIHGRRTSRGPRRSALGDEFASEMAATASRIKKRMHLVDEEAVSSGSIAAQESVASRRAARARAFEADAKELLDDLAKPTPLAKWTKLEAGLAPEDSSSAAAGRARLSKARLDDLELEMEEMAEKQARRERRAAALRALISETSSAADETLASASKLSLHRSEKTEKHVSF
ncbi:uncharacterized protein LOC131667765 [Phymastichus coffea]|uniref:uncharacterized protein LOC131667765 n=1 Tax=Phymastichus coffea TaxID=108790 RepID=UPI00273B6411|nr:uncharacterized protein LOC131667765 [Phymastichus coffea]XP_058797418.1 uncharacterized protein LOC131667765 [Phymastichus coffea]